MIQFNELRVTPDNKCLIIDVQIENLGYFLDVTIDSIAVDTLDTFTVNGPSSDAIIVYNQDILDFDIILDCAGQHVRVELKSPIISSDKNTMYFVYVRADISNAPCVALAPCICSSEMIVGTAINPYNLYSALMGDIRLLEQDCDVPKNLIDNFLRLQSVDAAIKAGNYPMAVKYWKKFFTGDPKKITSKPCGCYGRT